MKTAIVISTFSQHTLLGLLLHSLRISEAPDLQIVVADASGGTVVDRLAPEDRQTIHRVVTTDRTKHPATMDAGIRAAIEDGAEMIVQSNDDLVVPPEWLRVLRNEWETVERDGKKPGLLGASTNYIAGPQCRITGDYGAQDVRESLLVRPFFAMHSAAAYVEVGGYPTDCPVNWYADNALCLLFLRAGYHNFISRLFIPHFGSRSMASANMQDERRIGEFWMTRRWPGWKSELKTGG